MKMYSSQRFKFKEVTMIIVQRHLNILQDFSIYVKKKNASNIRKDLLFQILDPPLNINHYTRDIRQFQNKRWSIC